MSELPHPSLIAELEARQDDVIRRLDDLNHRIEAAICEFTPGQRDSGGTEG